MGAETGRKPELRTERRGAALLITLDRPERRNALTSGLLRALEQAFADAEAAADVDVIVLTGADPAFCAGVDLGELEETGRAPAMGDPLAGVTKPVIGAINGPAITGGLELALMCDLLVASERARFGDTHARIGLLPGWGQMARLPHAVGTRRAAELLLSSRIIEAPEAARIGLVNEVTPHERLLPCALELAGRIASAPQPAVRAILAQLREGAGRSIGAALAVERERADAWQGAGFDPAQLARQRRDVGGRDR
jgi:enoyl-CoA hydratase